MTEDCVFSKIYPHQDECRPVKCVGCVCVCVSLTCSVSLVGRHRGPRGGAMAALRLKDGRTVRGRGLAHGLLHR